ncbi:MAG: YbbR-like domain-containing protein [Candidatus Omnitrophota bacterium]|nr:YbbR-like domain-containing protein [Candidatus Omnitrophota bacterium]MBU1894216.1 YbbR-like domain-containing protein [Candidatus Omnitrophota bacterium]
MKLGSIIFNNFWPKIISLVLAVATWFYVFDLINSESFGQKKESAEDVFSRYKFIVKEVPVKPVFTGKVREGYKVDFNAVKIEPEKIAVFGPEEILAGVKELRTDKINLGEYTRSTNLRLGFNSDTKFLRIKSNAVNLHLPVEVDKSEMSVQPKN